jgi:hypothetical protein
MKQIDLSKSLIPAFYAVIMALVIFHAWNERSSLRKGGSSPLYRNLMDSPAWIRKGFDPDSILQMPYLAEALAEAPGGEWVQFETSPPRVMNAPLPDLPKRAFFSPMGRKAQEFTIIIPVEMDSEAIAYLNQSAVLPGIYFAHIGENWEIYINGNLVQSEMHLDKTGQPRTRRNWRGVFFPVNNSCFVTGTNILALRIVGDPAYRVTGLSYTSPHYLDEYWLIEKRNRNFLYTALCGIFTFIGVSFLLLFLFMRKKNESYYLWFSFYSILLGVYAVTRDGIINALIPGSEIAKRLEYFSLMLTVPMFGLFIETLWRKKITKISRGFLVFCLYLAVSQIFFCLQYGEEAIRIWDIAATLYYTYIFFYDIIYYYFWGRYKENKRTDVETPFTDILFGTIAVYFCGLLDVVDILLFSMAFNLFTYSAFVVQIGMTFALLKRFSGMYKGLETTARERGELLARIETLLNHTAVVPKSLAKGSLSFDIIAGRAFENSAGENIDLLLTQKEFAVLLLLAENEGKTLDTQTIYADVWKQPLRDDKNALKTLISKIRKKIEPSGYTVSVSRGEGYMFERI